MLALQCAQDAYRPCYWSARDRGRNFANTMEIAVAMANDLQLFNELQAQGRLSITSVNQIENAIPLCPLCHDAFDESSSPGFVFIPTDIQYFLDFEHRDYQRRRRVHKSSGELLLRVSPSATDYLQHQSQDGLIEERACGGLYTCYVLRHYMGKKLGHPEIDHGKSPYMDDKPWQGDPNTALSKAFRVVGAKPTAFPSEIRKALLDLSLLYCENDTYLQDQDSRLSRTPPTEDNPENGDDDLEDNSEDQGDTLDKTDGRALSSTKRLASNTGDRSGQRSPRGPLGVASRDARGNGQGAKEATLKRKADPDEESNSSGHRWKKRPTDLKWKWGPRATSQTAMKFYDDVYHLPHEHSKEVVIAGIAQGHE